MNSSEILQLAGAVLVLIPFALSQRGSLSTSARSYLTLNVIGATMLAVLAFIDRQWGFLLLEACWAAVAGVGLLRTASGRTAR
jgi:hypothetical protein